LLVDWPQRSVCLNVRRADSTPASSLELCNDARGVIVDPCGHLQPARLG